MDLYINYPASPSFVPRGLVVGLLTVYTNATLNEDKLLVVDVPEILKRKRSRVSIIQELTHIHPDKHEAFLYSRGIRQIGITDVAENDQVQWEAARDLYRQERVRSEERAKTAYKERG